LANVRVYRATPPRDDLFRMVFTINGDRTYQLRSGERYDFELPAGSYQFGYWLGPERCFQEVAIARGGNYVFRLAPDCRIVLVKQ
jgi:hypothetical protein